VTKNKREQLTKRQVQKEVDKLLTSGKCLSEMDGNLLNHLMWSQPSIYITFMSELNNRK